MGYFVAGMGGLVACLFAVATGFCLHDAWDAGAVGDARRAVLMAGAASVLGYGAWEGGYHCVRILRHEV
jgi:hypothetical protein